MWRQGHLLHFGFEQGPGELNENGRALLVNSICYISRFKEDRPIVRTPSIFYSNLRLVDRAAIDRLVNNDSRDIQTYLEYYLAAETRLLTKEMSREEVGNWYESNRPFLRTDKRGKFVIDEVARGFGVPPDKSEFFDEIVSALSAPSDREQIARSLLVRYLPIGPGSDASAAEWKAWFAENGPYLFFSDTGGYRWYVDPLSEARRVPSSELRGTERASAGILKSH